MNETMRTGQPAIVPTKLPVFEHRSQLVADSRDVAAMLDTERRRVRQRQEAYDRRYASS